MAIEGEAVGAVAPERSVALAPVEEPWSPLTLVTRALRRCDRALDRLLVGRWWAWRGAATALVVGMFLAAPPIGGWDHADTPTWRYVLANSGPRLFDPHVDLHDQRGNLTFRVVPRLIAAAFSFDHQWQYYVVQLAFGVLFLWAAVHLFTEALGSQRLGTLLAIATAGTWAGATAWVESRPFFDAIGIALLALAMRSRRAAVVAVLALAATFSDERALIALPLVLCWHALRPAADQDGADVDGSSTGTGATVRRFLGPTSFVLVGVVVAHLAIRTWLKHRYGLSEGQNRYPENPFTLSRNYPNGLWGAFEGLWFVVAAGLATLVHRRRWLAAGLVVLAASGPLLVGVSVIDISRAIAYAWPLAPVCALGLRGLPERPTRLLVWAATAACLAWPLVYASGDQTVDWLYPLPILLVHLATGVGT